MVVALGCLHRPPQRRQMAAILVAFIWMLPSLLILQLVNLHFVFWRFHAAGGLIRGVPVDLYLGWALAWAAIPTLLMRRWPLWLVVAAMFALDLTAMPLCAPVVELTSRWVAGEALALFMVLTPAQLFARWTNDDAHLAGRAVMHVISSGMLILFVLPESIFAVLHREGWSNLQILPPGILSLELQALGLLSVMGVSAVQEFAARGGGTPIPLDPPKRLVTSGVYAYVANPMQLSCTLVITGLGLILRDRWIIAVGVMSFIYGLGFAHWDESEDMRTRFGGQWEQYRRQVRPWWPRWRPWRDPSLPPARLYIAEGCGPCSEVRRWFAARDAVGLEIVPAELHPSRDLRRITYDPGDEAQEENGIAALARGLEHIHLGWAYLAALMRLPVICPALQLLADASGLGPRTIGRHKQECRVSEAVEVSH
jgi:protein-S-isoprenylcysteine O-methyltransferase Ste14